MPGLSGVVLESIYDMGGILSLIRTDENKWQNPPPQAEINLVNRLNLTRAGVL